MKTVSIYSNQIDTSPSFVSSHSVGYAYASFINVFHVSFVVSHSAIPYAANNLHISPMAMELHICLLGQKCDKLQVMWEKDKQMEQT